VSQSRSGRFWRRNKRLVHPWHSYVLFTCAAGGRVPRHVTYDFTQSPQAVCMHIDSKSEAMQLTDRQCTERSCPVDCCNWQLSGLARSLARSWTKVTCHWLAVWSLRAMSACSSSGTGAQHQLSMVLILKNLHSQFMCFMWIWEETAFISLYSINWMVSEMAANCLPCAGIAEYCRDVGDWGFKYTKIGAISSKPFYRKLTLTVTWSVLFVSGANSHNGRP
jgi:hypothetical protein